LLKLVSGADHISRAARLDAAEISDEQPLAGRGGDDRAGDVSDCLQRAIETATLHLSQRAGGDGVDYALHVGQLGLS
jgi:hypothetical protein